MHISFWIVGTHIGTLVDSKDPDEVVIRQHFIRSVLFVKIKQSSGKNYIILKKFCPVTPWVKVFRIIPDFRILRLTFHRKSASKC